MAKNGWMSDGPVEAGTDPVDLHTDRPHPARVYDYLLGGKDNYAADRAAAEEGMKANPNSLIPPRQNRAFLRRAVRYLVAEAGISQFLDIGTGIPTSPNVHEIAQAANPRARVVYVDNDPIVLSHARALLTSGPDGQDRLHRRRPAGGGPDPGFAGAARHPGPEPAGGPDADRRPALRPGRGRPLRPGRPAAGGAAVRQLPGPVPPHRRLRSGGLGGGGCCVQAQRRDHAGPAQSRTSSGSSRAWT